jgi:hypothetical protein
MVARFALLAVHHLNKGVRLAILPHRYTGNDSEHMLLSGIHKFVIPTFKKGFSAAPTVVHVRIPSGTPAAQYIFHGYRLYKQVKN